MKKIILTTLVLILGVAVFSGCTKKDGESVNDTNLESSVVIENTDQTAAPEVEEAVVPELEEGTTIEDLEKDLNNTNFDDIDIEVDSEL